MAASTPAALQPRKLVGALINRHTNFKVLRSSCLQAKASAELGQALFDIEAALEAARTSAASPWPYHLNTMLYSLNQIQLLAPWAVPLHLRCLTHTD